MKRRHKGSPPIRSSKYAIAHLGKFRTDPRQRDGVDHWYAQIKDRSKYKPK